MKIERIKGREIRNRKMRRTEEGTDEEIGTEEERKKTQIKSEREWKKLDIIQFSQINTQLIEKGKKKERLVKDIRCYRKTRMTEKGKGTKGDKDRMSKR